MAVTLLLASTGLSVRTPQHTLTPVLKLATGDADSHVPVDVGRLTHAVSNLIPNVCPSADATPAMAMSMTPHEELPGEPVCGEQLVPLQNAAPADYCKTVDMAFCDTAIDAAGAPSEIKKCEWPLAQACRGGGNATDVLFDQFGLEQMLLHKWRTSSQRCTANSCMGGVSAVVVPSYLFHCFANSGRPSWDTVLRSHATGLRAYWHALRERYHHEDPARRPLILVHHSFTFDSISAREVLSRTQTQHCTSLI